MINLKEQRDKIAYVVVVAIAVLGIILQGYYSCSKNLWLDEVFSLRMIEYSYWEMIQLTAADVHPPLYYLILKFFTDLICGWNNIEVIYVTKAISMIPYIVLLLIGIIRVRKQWGYYVSSVFLLVLVGMPQILSYGVEIRMYSWGILFVTLCYMTAYELMQNEQSLKKWAVFVAYGLLAAYTHYFACIAVAVVYVGLGIWMLFSKNKGFRNWLLACVATVIGYLPWLLVLIQQIKQVKESYWIAPISRYDLESYVQFVFKSPIVFLVLLLVILLLAIDCVRNRKITAEVYFAILGITVVFGTIFVGIVASKLVRPVFVIRYVVPGLVCLWFGLGIACYVLRSKTIKIIWMIFMLGMTCVEMKEFIVEEHAGKEFYQTVEDMVAQIEDDAYIVLDVQHMQQLLTAYVPNTCYFWNGEMTDLTKRVYGDHVGTSHDILEWEQALQQGKKVYFIEGVNLQTTGLLVDILEGTKLYGIDKGQYFLEGYCRLYQVQRKK